MIAAKRFQDSNVEGGSMFAVTEATTPGSDSAKESTDAIKVVLDFEHRDWSFVSQPGQYLTLSHSHNEILLTAVRGAASDRNEHLRQFPEVYGQRLHPSHTAGSRRWSSGNGRRGLDQKHHCHLGYSRFWTRDVIGVSAAQTVQPICARRYIRLWCRAWAFYCVSVKLLNHFLNRAMRIDS